MDIINRRLTLDQFEYYVKQHFFGTLPANKLVIHHTWKPTVESWAGERTIMGLKRYYEGKNWSAGPHLFIAEDGIWLFSPMRKNGIHAGRLNDRSIGIEVVGNYDDKVWAGKTKYNSLGAIQVLMNHLSLGQSNIYFHRDASSKSCPGRSITKEWLFSELMDFRRRPRIPGLRDVYVDPSGANLPTDDEVEIVNTVSVRVPDWSQESVDWVRQHNLFEVRSADDVRDAVKFHRFYKLIKSNE